MSRIGNTPMLLMATLMVLAPLSGCLSFITGDDSDDDAVAWVDPVVEIEDANHFYKDIISTLLTSSIEY